MALKTLTKSDFDSSGIDTTPCLRFTSYIYSSPYLFAHNFSLDSWMLWFGLFSRLVLFSSKICPHKHETTDMGNIWSLCVWGRLGLHCQLFFSKVWYKTQSHIWSLYMIWNTNIWFEIIWYKSHASQFQSWQCMFSVQVGQTRGLPVAFEVFRW